MPTTLPSGSDALGSTYAEIFGPVFWGFCVALILCGVTALQGYLYFTRYNDKLLLKLLVSMADSALRHRTLDFLSMSLISQSIYYYMLVVECFISAIITFTCEQVPLLILLESQLKPTPARKFLAVKRPGHLHRIMTTVVAVLAIGGLGCVGVMFMHPQAIFMNRNHTFSILAGMAKGFGATADIVATVAMCMFLKSAETGITRTSSLLKSLMHSSSTAASSSTACQGNLYWLALHVNTTKLYVNTFFGMLNARTGLHDKYGAGDMSISSSSTASHGQYQPTNRTSYRRSGVVRTGSLVIGPGARAGVDVDEDVDARSVEEKKVCAREEIRVTTSSTVAEI
ncbi:hypothetical protein C8J57DRAFT_1396638 [Mycena rebaudengoi]|nr:hypothetical protein C8J57DRAFT_1396638 [Mycena rebaudengoi]